MDYLEFLEDDKLNGLVFNLTQAVINLDEHLDKMRDEVKDLLYRDDLDWGEEDQDIDEEEVMIND